MNPADLPYYPLGDFGPVMKGMVIGGVGILHVFLAQFAIGGGMLMCYFEWLSQTGRNPHAGRFLRSYFQFLVLASFVLGALTGVGLWLTSIQVSPQTIGLMVGEFHWVWATEWTFFCLEVMAGYTFYRFGAALGPRARMWLLALYAAAAWLSLFWINGILSWQLTPGAWTRTGEVWDGFFNPSFYPSLLFRTVVAMALAGLVACVVINTMKDLDRDAKHSLIRRAATFLAPMAAMPIFGLWYLWVMPEDSRAWVMGGSTTMTLFLALAVGASVLIGGYALVGLLRQRLYINGATATLLCALAFGATAGGEFVREGTRKPFTVREALYSNAIRPAQVAELRRVGSVTHDPYPLRDADRYPNDQVRLGAKVYRFQCGVCHTISGANGLVHLTGSWTPDQLRLNIAKLQHTKPFMPPFAGNARELEGIVQMLRWEAAGRPAEWPENHDAAARAQVARWLEEAGTEPSRGPRRR
jgi:cytochrome d ubiquinol oxidase subunit I